MIIGFDVSTSVIGVCKNWGSGNGGGASSHKINLKGLEFGTKEYGLHIDYELCCIFNENLNYLEIEGMVLELSNFIGQSKQFVSLKVLQRGSILTGFLIGGFKRECNNEYEVKIITSNEWFKHLCDTPNLTREERKTISRQEFYKKFGLVVSDDESDAFGMTHFFHEIKSHEQRHEEVKLKAKAKKKAQLDKLRQEKKDIRSKLKEMEKKVKTYEKQNRIKQRSKK